MKTPVVMTEGASREVIFGVDRLERRWSFGIGAIGLMLSAIFLFVQQYGYTKTDPKNGVCPAGYDLVKKMCQHKYPLVFQDYMVQFLMVLVGALIIIFFTWRKKRVGIIFAAFMMGLALGNVGLPFLFLGGWLGIRAFRLQKYGDPTFIGSNQQSRLRAQERAANRKKGIGYSRGKKGDSEPSVSTVRPKPAPSKRYTPKQTGRRR
jgi:MFS family permease